MPRKKGQVGPSLKQLNEPEYKAWVNALHRCHNPAHNLYPSYGGRGINVSDQWRNKETGFATFLKDMGPRPGLGYSIERLCNNEGYSSQNCTWETQKTQCSNRRKPSNFQLEFGFGFHGRSPLIEYKGRIQSLSKWAEELGMKAPALRQRLRRGMSIEQAFTAKTIDLKRSRRSNVLAQITIR